MAGSRTNAAEIAVSAERMEPSPFNYLPSMKTYICLGLP
jgi:hypothetical protein